MTSGEDRWSRRGTTAEGVDQRGEMCSIGMPALVQGEDYGSMITARGLKWYPHLDPSAKQAQVRAAVHTSVCRRETDRLAGPEAWVTQRCWQ